MARGPKLHLKRLFAPKDWMLSKLAGVFAPRPRAGPHKLRESLPLLVILRNRLKYALNARESQMILRQRLVNVDGRPRTDPKYPAGFQDVIEIPRTGDRLRVLYDAKGRFTLVKVSEKEANIKLLKVQKVWTTTGRIPVITTHDGHRIRYPDPSIRNGDSILYDFAEGKIKSVIPNRPGQIVMVSGGRNTGRVGEILTIQRHPGAFDVTIIKDKQGHEFSTRSGNVFVIGNNYDSIPITLHKSGGVKMNPVVEREERLVARETKKAAAARQTGQKKAGRK